MNNPVLLDTHALLWFDLAPHKLSQTAMNATRDRGNRVLVSAVSALEIAIKYRLGKLPQAQPLVLNYEASLVKYGFEELPMASSHALRVATLSSAHQDPFDRVLAAQALELKIPLVTRDPAFKTFKNLKTVW